MTAHFRESPHKFPEQQLNKTKLIIGSKFIEANFLCRDLACLGWLRPSTFTLTNCILFEPRWYQLLSLIGCDSCLNKASIVGSRFNEKTPPVREDKHWFHKRGLKGQVVFIFAGSLVFANITRSDLLVIYSVMACQITLEHLAVTNGTFCKDSQ